MIKKEVADFLGVSVRAIERYTQNGKLQVEYRPAKVGGREAYYDPAAVEALKAEMEAPVKKPLVVQPDTSTALSPEATGPLAIRDGIDRLMSLIESVRSNKPPAPPFTTMSLADKQILSMVEAIQFTGLPEGKLKQAIKTGKLRSEMNLWGRGWRFKRADLEQFIVAL
jgi:excisionase family DNA binding protein